MVKELFSRLSKLLVIAVMGIFVLSGLSLAAEFSADYIHKMGEEAITGKVYVKEDKVRQEMVKEGKKAVMIIRMDKGVVWHFMPKERMYMEMPSVKGHYTVVDKELEKVATKKHLGREKVNGWDCDKYKIIYHDKSMGTGIHWISKKLNYPIKFEMKGASGFTVLTQYKNIKEQKLPDSLFEIPADYKKMSMPGMF